MNLRLLSYVILCITFFTTVNATKHLRRLVVYYPTGGENTRNLKDFKVYNNNF